MRRRGYKSWWAAILRRVVEAEWESHQHPVTGQQAWSDGYTVARLFLGQLRRGSLDPYQAALSSFTQWKRRPPAIYVYDIRLHPQPVPQQVLAAETKKRAAGAA